MKSVYNKIRSTGKQGEVDIDMGRGNLYIFFKKVSLSRLFTASLPMSSSSL